MAKKYDKIKIKYIGITLSVQCASVCEVSFEMHPKIIFLKLCKLTH